jgi:hypothetical protein
MIRKAMEVRDELSKFDRTLADSMKPLTDIENKSIYHQVIDKFATGQFNSKDAQELRLAVDKMQVQLKICVSKIEAIENRISSDLKDYLSERAQEFRDENPKGNLNLQEEAMFKELQVIIDLISESVTLKKFNLIGCKMRIYQERMKELSFIELLTSFRMA